MLAIIALGSLPNLTDADFYAGRRWVRMRGAVTQWGTEPVFGWMGAHARMADVNGTYREWAGAHAIWSKMPRKINCSEPPTGNFTYTFYVAKMIRCTEVELNYSGFDFYMAGYWNVMKTTVEYLVNEYGQLIRYTFTILPVVTNATGEMHVFNDWKLFEISIDGIDTLSGFVFMFTIRSIMVKMCDIDNDGKVDVIDLVRMARRFRAMPALGEYDLEMDFNCDYKIDIGDLGTLAANIEG